MPKLVRPVERGGYGLDALWNDDFHHSAMVALTGRNEAYYTDYLGTPQEFVSAVKYGYLYQGQWYSWQEKRRGTPALDLPPAAFVTFIQNHDQVANSGRGLRAHQLTSPGRYRAMTALLLLAPGTPMLFQGQEFAASTPVPVLRRPRARAGEAGPGRPGRVPGPVPQPGRPDACATCCADPHDPAHVRAVQARLRRAREARRPVPTHQGPAAAAARGPGLPGARRRAAWTGRCSATQAFVLRYFAGRRRGPAAGRELRPRPAPADLPGAAAGPAGGDAVATVALDGRPARTAGAAPRPVETDDEGWRVLGEAAAGAGPGAGRWRAGGDAPRPAQRRHQADRVLSAGSAGVRCQVAKIATSPPYPLTRRDSRKLSLGNGIGSTLGTFRPSFYCTLGRPPARRLHPVRWTPRANDDQSTNGRRPRPDGWRSPD